MDYCSRCVMPETAESLTFDEDDVCSVCRQIEYKHEKVDWQARSADLDRLLDEHRGKYDYDCIVPFSGGKDSTFTLWYLVKEKNLKPLVLRYDHGFFRPGVNENALRTFRILGVDVHQFTPNRQVVRKLMYESLRRRGDFCWHCHTGIFAYPMWVALRQDVPLLMWGEPGAEYGSFYGYDEEELVDERRFNMYVNLGINAEDMVDMLDDTISDYPITERDMKPFTYPPMAELRGKKVKSVLLGSYIPWDVRKQVEIIKRELDWRGVEVEGVPPQYDYEKIECMLQGVRDYIKFLKRGFGRTTHLASIDIRNHRLTREEAVGLVEKYDGRRPASLDVFLKILGISEDHFMELVTPHLVAPHTMATVEQCRAKPNAALPDMPQWPRVFDFGS